MNELGEIFILMSLYMIWLVSTLTNFLGQKKTDYIEIFAEIQKINSQNE